MSQGFKIRSESVKKSSDSGINTQELADIRAIQQNLVHHFADIKDPRVERTKKHQLTDILVIAILAVIAGASGVGRHRKLWDQ